MKSNGYFPGKSLKLDVYPQISGVYTYFFESLYVFFESLSVFLLILPFIFENKKTPLFVKITKRGVSNYNPYFPFDTVIRLTAR